MVNRDKTIAVIGAGVGGLAAAARLARRSFTVEVFEKRPNPGGRANLIEDRGFRFDTGPSFVLMPDFFEEFFTDCCEDIRDHLDLKPLDVSYTITFADGDKLTVYADTQRTRDEYARLEPGAAEKYDRYMGELDRMVKTVRPLLYRCFTWRDLLSPANWKLLYELKALSTYWQLARRHFTSEKICYSLTFQSMFIGVSPFSAPAFYSVITAADHRQKVFHPMGGMHRIPLALEEVGRRHGVRFHYSAEVDALRDDGAGVVLRAGGKERRFGRAVVNADYAYARRALLGERLPRYDYSCSVYLMYLGLKEKVGGLAHHGLFFAADVRSNLRDIFERHRVTEHPSFYAHVPTVTDPSLAPPGKEIVYVLIPVPNFVKGEAPPEEYKPALRRFVFDKLAAAAGRRIEPLVEVEHEFLPREFITRYNLQFAAAFGLAHTLRQSAFFRPPNRDPRRKNIYYVGASTQPGGGLPPALAGSKIVAELIFRGHET